MTNREAGLLGGKLLGLYTLIIALSALQAPISYLYLGKINNQSTPTVLLAFIFAFVPSILLFLFGYYLYFNAGALGTWEDPEKQVSGSSAGMTPQVVQRIAFSVVGLLILDGAIAHWGMVVPNLFFPFQRHDAYFWVHLAEALIQTALGLWLFFGTENFQRITSLGSRFIESLRGKSPGDN